MKTLFFGIVLILVIGVGGFVYRNVAERSAPGPIACTLEAKICPDGTSVGRTGPDCAFAPCPPPNVEFADKDLAFVLPAGFVRIASGAPGQATLAIYETASTTPDQGNVISVSAYAIPAGKTANDVILSNTTFSPSGQQPTSFDKFSPVFVNGTTFQEVTVERFEGQVDTAYFLPRMHDVLRFEVIERGVTDWSDSSLVPDELPAHKALLQMLGTLQAGS